MGTFLKCTGIFFIIIGLVLVAVGICGMFTGHVAQGLSIFGNGAICIGSGYISVISAKDIK